MDIVEVQFVVSHRGRGSTYCHTAKQKSKICPGTKHSRIFCFGGVEATEEEVRECEERTDGVTDGRKRSEVEYLEFSTPYFIPIHITVTILASAGDFEGALIQPTPGSYTFCRHM